MSLAAWEIKFASINNANLLQSYDYARAICPLKNQWARWGVIYIEGKEAGIVQVFEIGLFKNLIHMLQLDRGPLWFEGFGSQEDNIAFFAAFAKIFPARPLRWRRILPELPDTTSYRKALQDLGFQRLERPGYETIWLDINKDEEAFRAGFKGKWRNRLNAAEKAGFKIEWDWTGKDLSLLLTYYETDKITKKFEGPSSSILKSLAKNFISKRKMLIGTATLGKEKCGIVLFFLHGSCATYQTGWASETGKKNSAHNILLWQACQLLKRESIRNMDLGGVNDESAAGVKLFKEGLGGNLRRYIGHYS